MSELPGAAPRVSIQKTVAGDFDRIYPLLRAFDAPYTRDDWRRLFVYAWDGARDHVGFHLEADGRVVGFMGLIYSRRLIRGRQYTFCNITALIVAQTHRAATILLVNKLRTLTDSICTGLRPIEQSFQLFTLIGFVPFETGYHIIPTANALLGPADRVVAYEMPALLARLDGELERIVRDHASLPCDLLLLEVDGSQCLLVCKAATRRHYGLPVTKVQLVYISNRDLFVRHVHGVLRALRARYGVVSAAYIDDRFMRGAPRLVTVKRPICPPRICRGVDGESVDIDELYSEAVLL